MIKKNDIVMTQRGQGAEVINISNSATGVPMALVRLYRSQNRSVLSVATLRRHKWLND